MENNMIGGSGMSWMTTYADEQDDSDIGQQSGSVGSGSWSDMMSSRQQSQNAQRQAEYSQFQNGVSAIEEKAKTQERDNARKRQQWLCALVSSAYQNNGMSHRSLGRAASSDLGSKIYGVQRLSGMGGEDGKMNGSYAVYGDMQKPDGSTGVGVIGIVDPETILRTMEQIGPGAGNYGLRKQLWNDGGFDSLTPEQVSQKGLRNPDSVQVVGSTTISGSQAGRLFGKKFGSRPRTISTFAADGNGGFTNTEYNGETGERSVVNSGTRDPNYKGRWSVIESGPDGETQKNDLTGEKIFVPKGSSLRAEMTKASTPDKYGTRNAQMAKNADDNNANKERDRNLRERKMRLDTLNNMVEEKRKALGDTINEDEKKRIQGQIDELQNFIKMDIGIFGDASGASPSQPDNLVSALESAKARQTGNGATSSSENDDLANRINQTADHIDAMRERLKNAKTDKERNSVLAEIKKYEEMNKSLSAEYDKKFKKNVTPNVEEEQERNKQDNEKTEEKVVNKKENTVDVKKNISGEDPEAEYQEWRKSHMTTGMGRGARKLSDKEAREMFARSKGLKYLKDWVKNEFKSGIGNRSTY